MAPTARRAADCLFLGLLLLLVLDPPGSAAIPLCAGLAWLFAWAVALPFGAAQTWAPAVAGAGLLTGALLAASRPWALTTGWPVALACLACGGLAFVDRRRSGPAAPAVVAAVAFAADLLVLPGLYPSLHLALAVLAGTAAALALHRLLPRPMAGGLPLHVAGAACLLSAFLPAAASPAARRAIRDESVVGEKLLLLAWAASDLDGDGRSHLLGGGDPDPLTPTPSFRPSPPPPPTAPAAPLAARPVLVITADSLRADALGPETTPKLLELARHAWNFERAYAEAPATVPSFRSMLAGGICGPAQAVVPDRTHLRPVFEEAGFEVVGQVDAIGPGVTWVHFWDPHAPYPGPGDTPRERYANGVRRFDAAAGALIDRAPPDAAIIVTSDHGEAFGEHGATYHRTSVYDEQVRVPLLIRPGADAGDRRLAEPVGLRDLAATIRHLRACPAQPGDASLVVHPTPPSHARPIHLRTLRLEGSFGPPASMRGVVRGRWKLVHREGWNLSELYDLQADPQELTDLAAERPDLVSELLGLP